MSAVQWSEEYSVGIKSIDEQHKVLLSFINELNTAMAAGEANIIIGNILRGLGQYTQQHFEYEEALFAKHGYPSTTSHKHEHKALLEQVSSLKMRFESDLSGSLGLEIMQFLKNWLINHIQKSDREYADFLIAKGVT